MAAIGCLALLAPYLSWGTAVIFGVVAIGGYLIPEGSRSFDVLARPGDRTAGRLTGLIGFALASTALGILGTVEAFGLPLELFVFAVMIVGVGNLFDTAVRARWSNQSVSAASFALGGTVGALGAWAILGTVVAGGTVLDPAMAAFLATLGATIGALCRTDLYRRDDPVVLLSIGLVLWFLLALPIGPAFNVVLAALVITASLGIVAYLLDTASVAGAFSGMIVGYVTIVLAGLTWFILLLAFFGVGGLATKYRYEDKLERGVAERRRGARGTGNVLGNSLVAVLAVVAYVAAPDLPLVTRPLAALAFGGAVATALGDTLSSEIGALRDNPRLITTLEAVPAGTDGAVTVAGTIAGVAGAVVIGGLGLALVPELGTLSAVVVIVGGIVGILADSLYGATLEGSFLGNQGVNLLATATGALVAALGGLVILG